MVCSAKETPSRSAKVTLPSMLKLRVKSMVADKVTVITKAYGSDEAWKWESAGVDGYTVEACEKDTIGTDVIMRVNSATCRSWRSM